MSGERKRLKLHAYFKKEIWVILHKCLISFFFFWESRALCSPLREERLSTLHRSSLSHTSSEGSKTQWGRSGVRYTCMCYAYSWQAASLTFSLLPPEKKKGSVFPEPGTVPPGEQRWCGQEWQGHGLCPSAQGWTEQPGQGSGDWGVMRRSCTSSRLDAQFLPSQAQVVTPFICFAAHPALEEWDYK